MQEKKGSAITAEKPKRKWGSRILNFLMYGGWLLILFLGFGIVILVSILGRGC